MKIILASKSKARKKILEDCGFKVKVIAPDTKETQRIRGAFSNMVKANALKKINEATSKVKSGVIVACDTLVFGKKYAFGKPRNLRDAKRILKKLCQRPHWVYTGIAVLDKNFNKLEVDYEKTRVFMHKLSDKEIENYFAKNNPLDFAGAFDIQGQGALYIKRIEGCFYNVVGLPLAKLYQMLKKLGLLIVLLIFCLSIYGCTEFNPVTQKEEMILFSTEREVNIGKNIARQVENEYELVKNPLVIERINKIAEKIFAACDRKDINYYVNVIQAKEEEKEDGADINAFALPGGYVYIYDGLVDFVDNDDQLAGVIAHEISHIVAKHSIKKLQAAMGYALLNIAAIGVGDADFAQGVNYALVNILLAFSREDELLADKLGVRYAKEAGFKPRAMIEFLEKLREKKKKDPLRAKSIYRTHPYFSERIVAIKKEIGEPLTLRDYVSASGD